MKTKNIFNRLALVMLMPAMLLTTACSSSDDDVIVNNENTNVNTNKNGYTIPVTINVTRKADEATTRATYNEETKKLGFSTGDKLFVKGKGTGTTAGKWAGTLTWTSDGTFTGTIITQNEYTGDVNSLLAHSDATLLPAGYEDYDYFTIEDEGTYSADIDNYIRKAFALTKAAAVEQFSHEYAPSYSNGSSAFELEPANGILSFIIIGLTPSTEVTAVLKESGRDLISGNVTTDDTGTATFAMAVTDHANFNTLSLTVGGNDITLASGSKELRAGHIYNISRKNYPIALSAVTSAYVGSVIAADGLVYADAAAASAAGKVAMAKICYVGNDAETSTTYNHGLALALEDASFFEWCSNTENCLATQYSDGNKTNDMAGIANTDALLNHGSHTHEAASGARNYNYGACPIPVTSKWFLPSAGQWDKMITAAGGYKTLRDGFSSVGGTNMYGDYWTSTENGSNAAWYYSFYDDGGGNFSITVKSVSNLVRACLAF